MHDGLESDFINTFFFFFFSNVNVDIIRQEKGQMHILVFLGLCLFLFAGLVHPIITIHMGKKYWCIRYLLLTGCM